MAMPTDVGIIDTMIGFPHKDMKEVYAFITRQTKDRESKEDFAFPVEYMFKQVPEKEYLDVDDPISVTLHEMDRWGIDKGVIRPSNQEKPHASKRLTCGSFRILRVANTTSNPSRHFSIR